MSGRRLTVGAIWNVIGAVFNQGSTFLLGIIVAHSLGRELYGGFGFLQATLLMFSNFAQLALGFAALKYVAEYRVNDRPRAGRVIALCCALSVPAGLVATTVAIAAAHPIAGVLAHQPSLEPVIRFGAPAIAFVAVSGPLTGALAGMARFRSIALVGVVSGVAYIAIGTAGAIGWGLEGAAAGLSLSAMLQCMLLLVAVRKAAAEEGIPLPSIRRSTLLGERAVFMETALPAALTNVTTLPTLWLVTAILARQEQGMTKLALFTAANSLRLLVNFVPALVNNVGFSILSSHKGSEDHRAYWDLFRTNVLMVTGIAVAGAAVVAVGGMPLLRLFGRSFTGAYPVLLILLLATIAEGLAISVYQVIQTHGNLWWAVFGVAMPRDLVILVLAVVLAPRQGAIGTAVAISAGAVTTLASVLLIAARTRHSVGAAMPES
jgi:O-antigen/teichoic acid export membrane protein